MKKPLLSLVSVLTLGLLAACSGGAAAAAGVYEVDKASLKEAMLAAMPAEQKKEKATMDMVDGMVAAMSMTADLKADGTASMTMKGMMGQPEQTAMGTWKLDGAKLTITTKEKDGKEESKTADYANGSFTIEETEGPMKMKMTFKRK